MAFIIEEADASVLSNVIFCLNKSSLFPKKMFARSHSNVWLRPSKRLFLKKEREVRAIPLKRQKTPFCRPYFHIEIV
jgi:hypothetical protein